MTQPEIQEVTGLSNSTVSRWLSKLHVAPRLVYVHHYMRSGSRGVWAAVWSAGFNKEDALKPAPLSNGEYQKRWRRKKAAESLTTHPQPGVIRHVSN